MILVTGAGGHIGNVLIRELHRQGHTNLRLFDLPGQDISYIEMLAEQVVRGDIRDPAAVDKAVKGCDYVFHLAGIVTVTNRHKRFVMDVNYGGTQNVVQACIKHNVKRMIFVSSTDSLKDLKNGMIDETLETDIKRLKSIYAKSKALANLSVIDGINHGLKAVIVFPSAAIGPHDYRSSLPGRMIRDYIESRKTQFYFDGTYDFVDVRDVAQGMIQAWQNGKIGERYILSGHACSIFGMMKAVETITARVIRKRELPIFLVRLAAVLSPFYSLVSGATPIMSKNAIDVLCAGAVVCSAKAQRELGYRVRPLADTIRDIIDWRRKQVKK